MFRQEVFKRVLFGRAVFVKAVVTTLVWEITGHERNRKTMKDCMITALQELRQHDKGLAGL